MKPVNAIFFCRFRFASRLEDAPILLLALGIGVVSIAIAGGGVVAMREEVARLSDQLSSSSRRSRIATRPAALGSSRVLLPQFSGADLVESLNNVAHALNIPFDEASYALDSSATLPYTKYRVTLTTTAGYAEIRKFLPALSAELPHMGLDSIHCSRPDLLATTLRCELAFSAFYSKAVDRHD